MTRFTRCFRSVFPGCFLFLLSVCAMNAGCGRKEDTAGRSAAWANSTFSRFTDAQKFGQVFCLTVDPVRYYLDKSYKTRINGFMYRHHPGAVLFSTDFSNHSQDNIKEFDGVKLRGVVIELASMSETPLLYAARFETGACTWDDRATCFPSTLAFGATRSPEWAFRAGKITANESLAQGINCILCPVVNTAAQGTPPWFSFRCYGSEPDSVSLFVSSFVKGAAHSGVAVCLIRLELWTEGKGESTSPLAAGIEAGAQAFMGSPLDPSKLGSGTDAPLKKEAGERFGFQGVVVRMLGGDSGSRGRVEDVAAPILSTFRDSQDMLVLPDDIETVEPFVDGLLAQIHLKKMNLEVLDQSVKRILSLKESLNLHLVRFNPDAAMSGLGISDYLQTARDVSRASLTLLKNDGNLIPLDPRFRNVFFANFSDSSSALNAATFSSDLEQNMPDFLQVNIVHADDPRLAREALRRASEADIVICTFFLKPSQNAVKVSLPPDQSNLVRSLAAVNRRIIGISFAGPEIFLDVPAINAFLACYSGNTVDTECALDVLFGKAAVTGRLPMPFSDRLPEGFGFTLVPASQQGK